MRYVIGIDIGTTSTKAVAFTANGEVSGSAGVSYPVFTDAGGRHELDPDQLLEAVLSVLREVIAERAGEEAPVAVSFSCAMHSLILVDNHGDPLTRALTWADSRSEAYAAALKGSEAGRRIYRHTGTPIHAMSPLCKLLWLKEQEPELFRQAARFISIKEYIWWKLFGKYQIDYSIASATGLFDIRQLDWYPESLELAGIHASELSEPVSSTHRESELLPVWEVLGLPKGLPFIIGGSDGCLANLGTGAVRPGATALTIGTSGAVRMAVSKPEYDPQERIFSYILTEDLYICGGATNNGGNVIQWYADLVLGGNPDEAALQQLVASADSVPAGCEGLVFLPYLLGERAPIWDAEAKGIFFGVRSIHDQRYFMRAVLEGVSNCLRQVGASLEETIGPIEQIYASGGFTRNKSWLQLIADVFLKKVCVTALADASAIGAAMMGWYALGEFSGLHEAAALAKVVAVYEPDAARHATYRENYKIFTELYSRLKDLM
jgi:gluconokinase